MKHGAQDGTVQKETGGKIYWNKPLAWSNKLRSLCRILTIVVSQPAQPAHPHINQNLQYPLVLLYPSQSQVPDNTQFKKHKLCRGQWESIQLKLKSDELWDDSTKLLQYFPFHPLSVGPSVSSCPGVCHLCMYSCLLPCKIRTSCWPVGNRCSALCERRVDARK